MALIFGILAVILLFSNVFRASRPNTNPDPLTTYAVQPDRWLERGQIFFLEETRFSAFPVLGETMAVLPASLGANRTDRLSLLQLFEMSFLVAVVVFGCLRLCKRLETGLLCLCAALGTSMLAGWGALAKYDMMAAFFAGAGFILLSQRFLRQPEVEAGFDIAPFLCFSMAVTCRLAAWVLLPAFLIMVAASYRSWTPFRMAAATAALGFLPACYAVRSLLHTGTPFYHLSNSLIPPRAPFAWPAERAMPVLHSFAREGLFEGLHSLMQAWGNTLMLFIAGLLASVTSSVGRRYGLLMLTCVLAVAGAAVASLSPLGWGAKYTVPFMPFLAIAGAGLLEKGSLRKTVSVLVFAAVITTSQLLPRVAFTWSFLKSPKPLAFDSDEYWSPRDVYLWANDNLPDGSRILSLFAPQRYFSDHPIYVARQYPILDDMFIQGNLRREAELLEMLGIEYLVFFHADPMGSALYRIYFYNYLPSPESPDLASRLELLDRDASGDYIHLKLLHTGEIYSLYRIDGDFFAACGG